MRRLQSFLGSRCGRRAAMAARPTQGAPSAGIFVEDTPTPPARLSPRPPKFDGGGGVFVAPPPARGKARGATRGRRARPPRTSNQPLTKGCDAGCSSRAADDSPATGLPLRPPSTGCPRTTKWTTSSPHCRGTASHRRAASCTPRTSGPRPQCLMWMRISEERTCGTTPWWKRSGARTGPAPNVKNGRRRPSSGAPRTSNRSRRRFRRRRVSRSPR